MSNKEEMEEVSMEELLHDIKDKPVLMERDETGRWIENPAFTTVPRTGRLTYTSGATESGGYMYSTGTNTWIEK